MVNAKQLDFSKAGTLTVPFDTPFTYTGQSLVLITKNTDTAPSSTAQIGIYEPDYVPAPNCYVTYFNANTPSEAAMSQKYAANSYSVNATFTFKREIDVPKTGDDTPVMLMPGLALAAGAGFAMVVKRRKSC